jgi:hypothetical protein
MNVTKPRLIPYNAGLGSFINVLIENIDQLIDDVSAIEDAILFLLIISIVLLATLLKTLIL